MDCSSSYSNGSGLQEVSHNELVSARHAAYIALPDVLCAPSRPPSPSSEERILATKKRIVAAINITAGDTSNPKWGYVSRMVQLSCTSRRYAGVAPGVKIGEGRKVSVGKSFNWELPETEADWPAFEKRWEEAVAEEELKRNADKIASKGSRTSKYFKDTVTVAEDAEAHTRPSAPPSKAEVIREKVERWQAQVVTVATAPEVPMSQETVDHNTSPSVEVTKAKERPSQTEKVQASLGFRVMKRSSVTSGKGGSSAPSKPRVSPASRVPTPPPEEVHPAGLSANLNPDVSLPVLPPVVNHISEVSESSFFPPSFPSHLRTSTPPANECRHKPPPIAPCSPPPSSPLSARSPSPQRPAVQQASLALPAVSPAHKPTKRARPPNGSPGDVQMDSSPSRPRSEMSPVHKKAREEYPAQASDQNPPSSGPVAVPPSTPPPTSSPAAPVTPVSKGKGLGNARGLPVPSTPDAHNLPTLTELLASSRRSKPRPRPPSRKKIPQNKIAAIKSTVAGPDSELPALPEGELERDVREHTPEPSPSKTYFSSPASGSSDSPRSAVPRARSPVSPLFAQNSGGFKPLWTSTQQTNDPFAGAGGQAQTQGSIMRGSSGFFAMGYSSQFDVEGHVEQVSELLERDVDFNGWLRDMEPEEDEDQAQDRSMAALHSQSQDVDAIGAGDG